MIRVFAAALLLALAPALAPDARAAGAPTGLWLTEKEGVIVDLYECGADALCGRTVWLRKMTNKDGSPRLDTANPDPALRDRHWCGMEVITNVEAAGSGVWEGGEIYDPKSGRFYDFNIETRGERLKVRGYLGLPLLGKSETWTRTDAGGKTLCEDPRSGGA